MTSHDHDDHGHNHRAGDHDSGHNHGHTHGIVDPTITTSERGLWAIKWSFVGLAGTAAVQFVVVFLSDNALSGRFIGRTKR